MGRKSVHEIVMSVMCVIYSGTASGSRGDDALDVARRGPIDGVHAANKATHFYQLGRGEATDYHATSVASDCSHRIDRPWALLSWGGWTDG